MLYHYYTHLSGKESSNVHDNSSDDETKASKSSKNITKASAKSAVSTKKKSAPLCNKNPFVAKAVKISKMESIGWSLRSLDTIKDKNKVISRIKRKLKPGDIILLHDTNEHTLSLVKEIVSWLKNNAYNIVGLDTILAIEAYEAN